ncbi:kinase-like domain-containing protein [Hyaloraphidium curvatum]|nr:kinase-like domain-containing protein [Hyaloraphidium curvatum]
MGGLVVGKAPPENFLDDLSWLVEHLNAQSAAGARATAASLADFSGQGGLNAQMRKLTVAYDDGTDKKFVLKTMLEAELGRSKALGLARECFFYAQLAPELRKHGVGIAECVYVYGDISSGKKTIVLEDISERSTQSGYFFGPGSPHNWGKDLAALTAPKNGGPAATVLDVARDAFKTAARVHGTYWMDKDALLAEGREWLRGARLYRPGGGGEDAWTAAQKTASDMWAAYKAQPGEQTAKFDPKLVELIDAAMAKVSYPSFLAELETLQWTMGHGDFHPANALWCFPGTVLVDWEMVGVGSGPQDLAQYLISHMDPAVRRENERELLEGYYKELLAASDGRITAESYPFEACMRDYVQGGVARWVWMLPMCTRLPAPLVQYFQDQLAAFAFDHGVTPENVPMPRF